jgi:hypothetical protein
MGIIELGPSFNPLARKDAGWNTTVVDHDTREALAAKFAGAPGVDASAIEEVDIIWRDGPPRHSEQGPSGRAGVPAAHRIRLRS